MLNSPYFDCCVLLCLLFAEKLTKDLSKVNVMLGALKCSDYQWINFTDLNWRSIDIKKIVWQMKAIIRSITHATDDVFSLKCIKWNWNSIISAKINLFAMILFTSIKILYCISHAKLLQYNRKSSHDEYWRRQVKWKTEFVEKSYFKI